MEYIAYNLPANGNRLTQGAYVAGFAEYPHGPLVICLHGFPDTARSFFALAPALVGRGYRVVAPMLRGYEPLSQPTDGDYSLEALAQDVTECMDALLVKRAHIIGHDWGAGIGYTFAAQYPDRCLSLAALAVPHTARFLPHSTAAITAKKILVHEFFPVKRCGRTEVRKKRLGLGAEVVARLVT